MFLELARPFVPRHASTRLAFKRTNGRAGECASPPLPARPTSNSEERTSHAMKDCLRPRDEKEREREREREKRKKKNSLRLVRKVVSFRRNTVAPPR